MRQRVCIYIYIYALAPPPEIYLDVFSGKVVGSGGLPRVRYTVLVIIVSFHMVGDYLFGVLFSLTQTHVSAFDSSILAREPSHLRLCVIRLCPPRS